MSEQYIGEVRMCGFNFPPVGWAACNGQLLPISQYDALFNLLGTTYGGDGQNTFGLPNLCGRAPAHQGSSGGNAVALGEVGGVPSVTLNASQLPSHTHPLSVSTNATLAADPAGKVYGSIAMGGANAYCVPDNTATLAPTSVSTEGSGLPHSNLQPSLTINFIIALEGIYPSPS